MHHLSLPSFAPLIVGIVLAAACSSDPPETFGSSGAGGSVGSSRAGTPATTSGGMTPASGGSSAGMSSGGGAAGNLSSAGASTGGAAGTPANGGAAGAGAPNGGAAGSAGAAPCETVDCVAGTPNQNQDTLKSAFMLFGCYKKAAQDCITIPDGVQCPNTDNKNMPYEQRGITTTQTFAVGGVAGKKYALSIKVNGIAEAKYYEKGVRAQGEGDPANPDALEGIDTFYTGGSPIDYEYYNVYKLTSLDAKGVEIKHYYLNSFPRTNTAYEHHQTFPIAFEHDIEVVGGGSIQLLAADSNCHAIDNCGVGYHTTSCQNNAGRAVPSEPALKLPTTWLGKPMSEINLFGASEQPFHSQVMHIRASGVKPM